MRTFLTYATFGVDSLAVGAVLGIRGAAAQAELRVVGLLGATDAVATFAAGQGWVGVLAFLAFAVAATGALGGLREDRGRAFAILALTGIDNLLAPQPWQDALAAGVISALMAGIGLRVVGPLLLAAWTRLRTATFDSRART